MNNAVLSSSLTAVLYLPFRKFQPLESYGKTSIDLQRVTITFCLFSLMCFVTCTRLVVPFDSLSFYRSGEPPLLTSSQLRLCMNQERDTWTMKRGCVWHAESMPCKHLELQIIKAIDRVVSMPFLNAIGWVFGGVRKQHEMSTMHGFRNKADFVD